MWSWPPELPYCKERAQQHQRQRSASIPQAQKDKSWQANSSGCHWEGIITTKDDVWHMATILISWTQWLLFSAISFCTQRQSVGLTFSCASDCHFVCGGTVELKHKAESKDLAKACAMGLENEVQLFPCNHVFWNYHKPICLFPAKSKIIWFLVPIL